MKSHLKPLLAALSIAAFSMPALADDDVEGQIESIDASSRSFVVQGERYHVTDTTDFDDGLRGFGDLKAGQRVEVDYTVREGRRVATEIELDD